MSVVSKAEDKSRTVSAVTLPLSMLRILNGYENIGRNFFFTVKEERKTRGNCITLA